MLRFSLLLFAALGLVPVAAWPQGTPLGPEFRVATYTTADQDYPAVAFDASGNFVVVWRSDTQDGSSGGIFGQRYASSGAPLGPEFRVNTYTTSDQSRPVVASDPSGNFVVVWNSAVQAAGSYGIFGQRYASSGAPLGPEFQVSTGPANYESPSVASDSSGKFVVVWNGLQPGSEVFGQRYDSTGAPLGSEFRVNTYTTNLQDRPAVASDPLGNFVVVWRSYLQDGSHYGVFGQRFASSGSSLGPEFRVNTYTTGTQLLPVASLDAAGNFVVVWMSDYQDGNSFGIFGQRYSGSGAALGSRFQINTTVGVMAKPTMASDASGNFVVVWTSLLGQDGSYWGAFGRRFASSGSPLGPEFQVNSFTFGYQVFPWVAAASTGDFVVVWQSYPQDGSGYGVFGQRYGQIVPVELMRFGVE